MWYGLSVSQWCKCRWWLYENVVRCKVCVRWNKETNKWYSQRAAAPPPHCNRQLRREEVGKKRGVYVRWGTRAQLPHYRTTSPCPQPPTGKRKTQYTHSSILEAVTPRQTSAHCRRPHPTVDKVKQKQLNSPRMQCVYYFRPILALPLSYNCPVALEREKIIPHWPPLLKKCLWNCWQNYKYKGQIWFYLLCVFYSWRFYICKVVLHMNWATE